MNGSLPNRLFKFLPSKYVEPITHRGCLLFRNFTYFRQIEDKARGDYLEAHHRDNPDHHVQITNMNTGNTISGDYSFLNSTNSDEAFMFCLSNRYEESLFEEFESDACIEITDVPQFIQRTRIALARLASKHPKGLISRPVTYYKPNVPCDANIKDATALPFLKDEIYSHQSEYRLVFGTRKAFRLEQRLVLNTDYDFRASALQGTPKEKQIRVGSIADITVVHKIP